MKEIPMDLKPCPFCGSTVKLKQTTVYVVWSDDRYDQYTIRCDSCEMIPSVTAGGPPGYEYPACEHIPGGRFFKNHRSDEAAIETVVKKWNTRRG